MVLTFANPRVPLYDLYAAGIAVTICRGVSGRAVNSWAMVVALAVALVPWLVTEFTKTPLAWPWWTLDYLVADMAGMAVLLIALARTGLAPEASPKVTGRTVAIGSSIGPSLMLSAPAAWARCIAPN